MSDATTIARPYAKAIFKHALAGKSLSTWSIALQELAQTILDTDARQFICNPATTVEQQAQLLLAVYRKTNGATDAETVENLIGLLAANRRLLVLPDIYIQF